MLRAINTIVTTMTESANMPLLDKNADKNIIQSTNVSSRTITQTLPTNILSQPLLRRGTGKDITMVPLVDPAIHMLNYNTPHVRRISPVTLPSLHRLHLIPTCPSPVRLGVRFVC